MCRVFCTGAYGDLLALPMRTWLLSSALNTLVTMAGMGGIQHGPRLELVQIPLKRMTTETTHLAFTKNTHSSLPCRVKYV